MDVPAPYRERIAEVAPRHTDGPFALLSAGPEFDHVLVDQERVFRFAKTPEARRKLSREANALALIRRYVRTGVPRFDLVHEDVASYLYMPGEELTETKLKRLPTSAKRKILTGIGKFMRQCHSIVLEAAGIANLERSSQHRNRDEWVVFYQEVRDEIYPHLRSHQIEAIETHFDPMLEGKIDFDYDPVPIHGDLTGTHILWDPLQHSMVGVIDFTKAGLGDPAVDLATLIAHYGESSLGLVMAAYPEIRFALDRARFWAGTFELESALRGLQTHDPTMQLRHLGEARDRRPIVGE